MPSTEPSCCPSSPQLACRPPPATAPLPLRCAGAIGVAGPALPGVLGLGREGGAPLAAAGRLSGGWPVCSLISALQSILKLRRMGFECVRITPCMGRASGGGRGVLEALRNCVASMSSAVFRPAHLTLEQTAHQAALPPHSPGCPAGKRGAPREPPPRA